MGCVGRARGRFAGAIGAIYFLATLSGAGCKGPAVEGRATASAPASASVSASVSVPAPVPAPAPAAATPSATATAQASTEPSGKIVVFGDSITQADWREKIEPSEKWVTRLGAKSDRITAVNAGKNGRTTSAKDELSAAIAANPDAAMVILFLGVNDMKNAKPGVVERTTSNMSAMIDLIKREAPTAQIVLCAPITINPQRLTSYWREKVAFGDDTVSFMRALSIAYEALARKKQVRFINLLHAVSPENIPDGVHPNGVGQGQIADAVWKGLTSPPTPATSP